MEAKQAKLSQEQLYDLLLSEQLSWQALLYELIRTEQLDPWDIDLVRLATKYLEKVQELQEGLFLISSKVLLAAAILLRMKSELLHESIQGIDELLFERKQQGQQELVKPRPVIDYAQLVEQFQFDQPEALLLPRTPLPRARKVTLPELLKALEKAIATEERRIKRIVLARARQLEFELPRKRFSIREKIRELYQRIKEFFLRNPLKRLSYAELVGHSKEQQIACFLPILHLAHQSRIELEQQEPFGPIYIALRAQKLRKYFKCS